MVSDLVMRIGEVAASAGVSVEALRYYEQRGLLPKPARTDAGYRQYSPEAVRVVRFIKHAQILGFTLADIADLLRLASSGRDNCHEVHDFAQTKIDDITVKVDRLSAIRDALNQLTTNCDLPRTRPALARS